MWNMMNKSNFSNILFLLIALCIIPQTAEAYIDLGTGSLIVQAVLAAFFGASLAAKIYWHKLKRLFGFGPRSDSNDDERKENAVG